MRPHQRRHYKQFHCGFCGCEITLREKLECGDCCWICRRNREDRAAVENPKDEGEQDDE